jgi:hypothetical protein
MGAPAPSCDAIMWIHVFYGLLLLNLVWFGLNLVLSLINVIWHPAPIAKILQTLWLGLACSLLVHLGVCWIGL